TPWLMPPPSPGPSIGLWHRFLRTPATPTPFSFAEPAAAAADADGSPAAPVGSAGSTPSTSPAASAPRKLTPPDEVLEKQYDRLVPKTGLAVWGRIKNPSRFDLKESDPILFQQFDVVKGVPFGAPYAWPRADVLRFDFAKTILNQMELR